jgi:hypothetical protein
MLLHFSAYEKEGTIKMSLNFSIPASSRPKHKRTISISELDLIKIANLATLSDFSLPMRSISISQHRKRFHLQLARSQLKSSLIKSLHVDPSNVSTSSTSSSKPL